MLKENQFLKIRKTNGGVEMEIFELPAESWRRPLRWRKVLHPASFNNPKRNIELKQFHISRDFEALFFTFNTEFHSGGIDAHVNRVIAKHKRGAK